jgi:hypothetical protein
MDGYVQAQFRNIGSPNRHERVTLSGAKDLCISATMRTAREHLARTVQRRRLGGVGLFLRHVAYHGKLEHLSLVSLQHQDKPENESSQTNQWPNEKRDPTQNWNVSNDSQAYADHNPRHTEEYVLKGVEANEAVPVVRLDNQKNDSGDDRNVRQQAGHIIGEPAGRARLSRNCRGCTSFSASRTDHRAIRHLRTAGTAELSHFLLLVKCGVPGPFCWGRFLRATITESIACGNVEFSTSNTGSPASGKPPNTG